MRRSRRPALVLVIAGLAIVGILLAIWLIQRTVGQERANDTDTVDAVTATVFPQSAPGTDGADTETTSADPVPTPGLEDLATQLRSGDKSAVSRLLGRPDGVEVDEAALDEVVAELATVEFDSDTITVLDDDAITVEASTSTGDWLFYLVQHDQEWRVALTEELP